MQQARHRTKLKGEFLPTRIDKALVHAFPHLSRRLIRRCLDAGGVYLNQHRVRISSHLAFSGDVVDLHVPANGSYTPPKLLSPDILYESTQVVAVNKPPGLATQATRSSSNHPPRSSSQRNLSYCQNSTQTRPRNVWGNYSG